jgi:hypothetical protein
MAGEYFEIGTPPAYGIYARNVRGLTLDNVRLEVKLPDLRPAVMFDHVADASVNGLSAQGNPKAESLLRFSETRDVLLTALRVLTPAAILLKLEGPTSSEITIDGGDVSKAAKALALSGGATAKAVKLNGK